MGVKMKSKRFLLTTTLVSVIFFFLPLRAADDDSWLAQARGAYYGLDAQRLKHFECVATLMHDVPGASLNLSPTDQILLREGLRFAVTVDDYHQLTVTPYPMSGKKTDLESPLTKGDLLLLEGALQTWGDFVLANPFMRFTQSTPVSDGLHSLRLNSNKGSALRLSMTDNYMIKSIEETTKSIETNVATMDAKMKVSTSTTYPTFITTDKGLLLKSVIIDTSAEGERTSMVFEYGDIDKWALPTKLRIEFKVSGQPVGLEITFSNYKTNSARKSQLR
jgi:hypothetical protein